MLPRVCPWVPLPLPGAPKSRMVLNFIGLPLAPCLKAHYGTDGGGAVNEKALRVSGLFETRRAGGADLYGVACAARCRPSFRHYRGGRLGMWSQQRHPARQAAQGEVGVARPIWG